MPSELTFVELQYIRANLYKIYPVQYIGLLIALIVGIIIGLLIISHSDDLPFDLPAWVNTFATILLIVCILGILSLGIYYDDYDMIRYDIKEAIALKLEQPDIERMMTEIQNKELDLFARDKAREKINRWLDNRDTYLKDRPLEYLIAKHPDEANKIAEAISAAIDRDFTWDMLSISDLPTDLAN